MSIIICDWYLFKETVGGCFSCLFIMYNCEQLLLRLLIICRYMLSVDDSLMSEKTHTSVWRVHLEKKEGTTLLSEQQIKV